jgi:hypothetical protein
VGEAVDGLPPMKMPERLSSSANQIVGPIAPNVWNGTITEQYSYDFRCADLDILPVGLRAARRRRKDTVYQVPGGEVRKTRRSKEISFGKHAG